MRSRYLILLPLAILNVTACCQSMHAENIPFDVTFWSKELRLKKEQVFEIHRINQDFYCALAQLAHSECVQGENFQTILKVWRTAILCVLTPRQKGKWEKLVTKYSMVKITAKAFGKSEALGLGGEKIANLK